MIGQVLGHYRIDARIGEGGMGVVYRARDEFLHRDVALKVLSKGTVPSDSTREYVLHEARSSSALSHPNICTIHEVGELNNELYIVMELVEGKPLSTLLAGEGLPVESLLRYGVQIAGALSHSHGRNIIHRDLKSSNIMITSAGLVKVLDFGLAKRSEKDLLDGATQTIGPLDTAQGLPSKGAPRSKSAPPSFTTNRRSSPRAFPPASGPLFNVVWPRSPRTATNKPVKCTPPSKLFNRQASLPRLLQANNADL